MAREIIDVSSNDLVLQNHGDWYVASKRFRIILKMVTHLRALPSRNMPRNNKDGVLKLM